MHTTTQIKAARLASKLAALADPARNSNEAERAVAMQRLIDLCGKHGLTLADYIKPVASPDAGEAAKPEPEAVKPDAPKAAKPKAAKPDKRDAADAERERATANRIFTAQRYSGPSQASHATRAPKLSDAIERVAHPVQRAKSASTRDESGIMLAAKHANGSHDFDPCAATFDLGVLSRLASLGMLKPAPCGKRIRITKAGRDLAANVARKAA